MEDWKYKRGLLAEALMQYPTLYSDSDIDYIASQYSKGGLLDKQRAKEALGDAAAVMQLWNSRKHGDKEVYPQFQYPNLFLLQENLLTYNGTPTRLAHDVDSYWPDGSQVSYDNLASVGMRDSYGTVGAVHPLDSTVAHVIPAASSRYKDTLGHELHHTKQNNTKDDYAISSPGGYDSKDVTRVPNVGNWNDRIAGMGKLTSNLIQELKTVEKDLPGNFSESPKELAAALAGYESALPSNVSLKDDPIMSIILNNPDYANWYLQTTGRMK